ncbi:hypothetical protein LSH36_143g06030, partial [Paralvinella palmiformis]
VVNELHGMLSVIDEKTEDTEQCPEWRLQLLCMMTSQRALWEWSGIKAPSIKTIAITMLYVFTYPELLAIPSIKYNGLPMDLQKLLSSVPTPTCRHKMLFTLRYVH